MKTINIEQLIFGATSQIRGDGGLIGSTPEFARLDEADQRNLRFPETLVYQNLSSFENIKDSIIFKFPVFIKNGGQLISVFFRGQARYTKHGVSEYYRRECYFTYNEIDIDETSILKSIPPMTQLSDSSLGKLSSIEVKTQEKSKATGFSYWLIEQLLQGNTLEISAHEEDRLMESLSSIPYTYQKYIGYGFNLPVNPPKLKDYLHIYTVIDGGQKLVNIKESESFVEYLFSSENKYTDKELELLKTANKESLQKLLKFHRLHYHVDHNQSYSGIESDITLYINQFATDQNRKDNYIVDRISSIYRYFCESEKMTIELFERFKSLNYPLSKSSNTKSSERVFFDKIDLKDISSDKGLNYLQTYKLQFSEKKKEELVRHIGVKLVLENWDKLKSDDELLVATIRIVKASDFVTKLIALKVLPNFDKQFLVDRDYQCDSLDLIALRFDHLKSSNLASNLKLEIAKKILESNIDFAKKYGYKYYTLILPFANSLNFQTYVEVYEKEPNNLLDFYNLLLKFKNEIKNKDEIDKIAKSYIDYVVSKHDPLWILDFVGNKNSSVFVQYNSAKISSILLDKIKIAGAEELKTLFFDLLQRIVAASDNLFFQQKELLDCFIGIENLSADELNALKKHRAAKTGNGQIVKETIQEVVRRNKPFKKEINYNLKFNIIFRVVAILLFIFSLGGNVYFIMYKPVLINPKSDVMTLDTVIPKSDLIKMQLLIDSLALNPFPNTALDSVNVQKLYLKGNKSDSVAMGLPLDSVVKIIFLKNSSLKKEYNLKSEYYGRYLKKRNSKCFDEKNVLIDTIRYIPTFKGISSH